MHPKSPKWLEDLRSNLLLRLAVARIDDGVGLSDLA